MLPHAKRTPWVPSNICRGGTAVGETREEGGSFILEYVTVTFVKEESIPKGRGDVLFRVHDGHSCKVRIKPALRKYNCCYATISLEK